MSVAYLGILVVLLGCMTALDARLRLFFWRDALAASLKRDYPFLSPQQAARYARSYGLRAHDFLKGAAAAADLGQDFGATFTEKEALFMMETEWARTADDMLWRRSKLGLHMTADQRLAVDRWVAARQGAEAR